MPLIPLDFEPAACDAPIVEHLDAWVYACADADCAYGAWRAAGPSDRRDAYAVYVAALDREEAAATALRDVVSAR